MRLNSALMIKAALLISVSLLPACGTFSELSSREVTSLDKVKFYYIPDPGPPPPGTDYVRLLARVDGRLNMDAQGCLRIGEYVPILRHENLINIDAQGFYIQHENGGQKFRLGDYVRGGGGYSSASEHVLERARNGATLENCSSPVMPSFYLSAPRE